MYIIMNNKDYAIYNEHFINPKNNIYYKIYNNTNIESFDNINNDINRNNGMNGNNNTNGTNDMNVNNNINGTNDMNINNNIDTNIIAQGKQVILVDSDNPWYINVSAEKIPAIYKNIDFDKINGYSGPRTTADFQTNMPDNTKYDLVSTYSLKDRLTKLTQIEAFSNIENNSILYIGLITIILIILIKYIKK